MSAVTSTNALAKDSTLQDVADAISTMGATSVGNLSALTTTDKTSLVGAVNEVKSGLVKVVTLTGQGNATIDISSLGFTNPVVTVSAQFSDTYIILAQASIDNGSLKVQVKYWTGQAWDTTSATWCATITELATIS